MVVRGIGGRERRHSTLARWGVGRFFRGWLWCGRIGSNHSVVVVVGWETARNTMEFFSVGLMSRYEVMVVAYEAITQKGIAKSESMPRIKSLQPWWLNAAYHYY